MGLKMIMRVIVIMRIGPLPVIEEESAEILLSLPLMTVIVIFQ